MQESRSDEVAAASAVHEIGVYERGGANEAAIPLSSQIEFYEER